MCGIIGITSRSKGVASDLYAGLWSLQHRGKESAGIVTYEGGEDNRYCTAGGMGTVEAVFGGDALTRLRGNAGIGHVRYSTSGESSKENIQPIEGSFHGEKFFLAHNGNLVRFEGLKDEALRNGYQFRASSDTEVIAALVHFSKQLTFEDAFREALGKVSGTYALVALYEDKIFGVRDPSGNRPLVLGSGKDGVVTLSSESATLDVLKFRRLRDVAPGEMIILDAGPGKGNWCPVARVSGEEKFCIFEFVYFLRPDSIAHGRRAQSVREEMGRTLWREHPVEADCVVPVPDSGNFAAFGVAKASQLPLEMAFFRSHYVGRTFIEPLPDRRERGLRIKLNLVPDNIEGKRVVVVDDSIVRATVMSEVVASLRDARVKEVHVRISSPPYRYPCHYGIDTNRIPDELIAKRLGGNVESIRRWIGADTLEYLSLEGLKKSINGGVPIGFCDACFTGDYYIPLLPSDPQASLI